jgi:hypothetical protein
MISCSLRIPWVSVDLRRPAIRFKVLFARPDGPHDAGEFVRDSHGRAISAAPVGDGQCPWFKSGQWSCRWSVKRGTENGATSVRE